MKGPIAGSVSVLILSLGVTSPAVAQDHCKPAGSGQVRVDLPVGSGSSIYVAADGQITYRVGGTDDPCGSTRDTTVSVTVSLAGQDGNETFVIDHSGAGGPFIQTFNIDLGGGDNTVAVHGDSGNDRVTATSIPTSRAMAAADTHLDMEMYDPVLDRAELSQGFLSQAHLLILLFGGLDIFSVASTRSPDVRSRSVDAGTAALTESVIVQGGGGNDRLTGGSEDDALLGGGGKDRLVGGKGRDLLAGGPGNDNCRGGPGKDQEKGCE